MHDLNCSHCQRFLGKAAVIIADILCPSCKGSTQFKIMPVDQSKMLSFKFAEPARQPKKKDVEVS